MFCGWFLNDGTGTECITFYLLGGDISWPILFSFNKREPFLEEIFQMAALYKFAFVGRAFAKKKEKKSENINSGY